MISQRECEEVTAEKRDQEADPRALFLAPFFSLERCILTQNRGIPAFFLRCRLVWVIRYCSRAEVLFGGSPKVKVTLTGRSANESRMNMKQRYANFQPTLKERIEANLSFILTQPRTPESKCVGTTQRTEIADSRNDWKDKLTDHSQ